MLSEADKLLITAAVDGELTPDEGRAFEFLVATSKPAAALYDALAEDRDRLAGLPKVSAPATLYPSIFAQLQALPSVEPTRPRQPARRSWLPVATAASFLLAVASGTYWFASTGDGRNPRPTAAKQVQQLPKEGAKIAPPVKPTATPNAVATEEPLVSPIPDPPVSPAVVAKTDRTEPKPEAVPTPGANVMAAPVGSEVKAFDRVDVKLPLLMPFVDLSREESQTALRAHLNREPATRIDLFAKDSARAAEALVAAGKGANVNVIVDTIAGERMKRKMPSTWVVYTDALTADEAAKWLAAAATKQAAETSPDGQVFGPVHVLPTGQQEQKDTLAMLNVDLAAVAKKPKDAANGHVAAKTLDQVAAAIQKTDPPKAAILLTYQPAVRLHPSLSKDVKHFHEARGNRGPNTVPVFIVIRSAGQ
jgi:hypothetical protein